MRLFYIFLATLIATMPLGYCGDSKHQFEYDSEADEEFAILANTSSLGTSMVGWGIGMAVVSAVIAAVVKPSTTESSPKSKHAHAHCD